MSSGPPPGNRTPTGHKGPRARARSRGGIPEPIRPKGLFERPWPWLILAGLLGGAITAGALSLLRGAQDAVGDASDRSFRAIAIVGVVAVVLMLATAFYSARKRRRAFQEHLPGTMMTWLGSHVWLGILALFAVLVHAWLYPITSKITTGKITLLVLVVLVLSGVAWRIVYAAVPRRVPGAVGNLSVKDTRSRLAQIQVEIEKVTAGASDQLRALVQARLAGRRPVADLDREAATLEPRELGAWEEFKALAERRERHLGREPKQERYHRILQGWKLLHLPLAAVLGAVLVIHILDVFGVGRRVFANAAVDRIPSSARCVDCHSTIVRQWMLAIHSDAQATPTTVAQTALALKVNPNLKQVCTNCHAPLGTALSPSTTFPLPGEDHDAVLSEGVTCWTCHALPNTPSEVGGAEPNFPVHQAGTRSFGAVFNPPVGGEPPLPVPDHQIEPGFMTGDLGPQGSKVFPGGTFNLCGACHDVKVDLDGNGLSAVKDPQPGVDTNGDGVLDENELQIAAGGKAADVDGSDINTDLVLQTTFDEWQDYVARTLADGGTPATCATCHMPSSTGPIVDDAPGGLALPDRTIHSHEFIGVDYDLTPGHYAGLGVGGTDGLKQVLAARQKLIDSGVSIATKVVNVNPQTLTARVTVSSGFIGHNFPSGFAFARQWWLEVSATTADGKDVCLEPVNPATGQAGPGVGGIASPCASGHVASPQEDLKPCDPEQVFARFDGTGTIPIKNGTVHLDANSSAPLTGCDPWLTNFQKILTDGDPDGDGTFNEVPYQSLLPDIVKNEVRVADQQAMGALLPYDNPKTKDVDEREREFAYVFDVSQVRGQDVTVHVVMHLRNLPPYFITALDGFYPNGLTADVLLKQMVVSDIRSPDTQPVRVP